MAAFGFIVVILMFGCSGDGTNASTTRSDAGSPDAGSSDAGTADAGALLDELRSAFCKAVRACCSNTGAPPDPLADCETEFERQIPVIQLAAKGTILIDEAKLRACLPRLEEQSKTCLAPEDICFEAFFATLAEGAACTSADECKHASDRPIACVKTNVAADSGPNSGTCRALVIGKSGDACARSCAKGRDCSVTISTFESDPLLTTCREDDGLYCDSTHICAAILADGAPCATSTSGCSSASFCSNVCMPRKAEGSSCASFLECRAGMTCAGGTCAVPPFATPKLCSGDYN